MSSPTVETQTQTQTNPMASYQQPPQYQMYHQAQPHQQQMQQQSQSAGNAAVVGTKPFRSEVTEPQSSSGKWIEIAARCWIPTGDDEEVLLKKRDAALKRVNAAGKVVAERFKTKVCKNYVEMGMCPYESRCRFAHGDEELRTTEMNLRDGIVTEDSIRHFKRMQVYKFSQQAAVLATEWSAPPPQPAQPGLGAMAHQGPPSYECALRRPRR